MGRFINADDSAALFMDHENVIQYNLYAYAFNNPIEYEDSEGYWAMTKEEKKSGLSMQIKNGDIKSGEIWTFGKGLFKVGAKGVKYVAGLVKAKKISTIKILGKGSTGRIIAKNKVEESAMSLVKSNPLSGATKLNISLNDSRWLAKDGWVKYARNVNGVEIHFNYNTITKVFDDFKFKGW